MNLNFFNDWLQIVTFKKSVEKIHKEKPELGNALVQLIVAGVIVGVLSAVTVYFVGSQMAEGMAFMKGASLLSVVTTPLSMLIGAAFASLIFHVVSKLLGGKGTFMHFLSVYAVVAAAVSGVLGGAVGLLTAIVAVLGLYLTAASVLGVLQLLVSIVGLILLVKTIKAVEVFSTGKAVIAFILGVVLVFVLVFLLITLFGAALFGGMMG